MSAAQVEQLQIGRAEYARLLHQMAAEVRELKACVTTGFRPGVERMAAKLDYLAFAAGRVEWGREPSTQEREAVAVAPIRKPDYLRNPRSRAKNPQTGMRQCSRCHTLLPLEMFSVTDAKSGKRRADCKPCYNKSQRTRYVRAGYKIVTVEVLDGDPCIGHPCTICGKPFKVGQHIQGENLHHEGCATNEGAA